MVPKKSVYEDFAKFFEKPTREDLRALLQSHFGEQDFLDFKEEWPSDTKLVKHLLALANSVGGAIVLGVRQEDDGSLTSVGLSVLRDKADISKAITAYLPPNFEYLTLDFTYTTSEYEDIKGKQFQVLIVESDPKHLPYLALKSGSDLRANAVYVRRGTQSVEANHDELERLLNERIESGYSSTRILELEEHLEQLKTLYGAISRTKSRLAGFDILAGMTASMFFKESNPHYPEEDYDEFVGYLIERKKKKIEQVLEI